MTNQSELDMNTAYERLTFLVKYHNDGTIEYCNPNTEEVLFERKIERSPIVKFKPTETKGGNQMTNYNERLDKILRSMQVEEYGTVSKADTKQAITSLIKELVAEARIDELKHLTDDGGIWYQDMARQFPQKIRIEERIKELEV